MCRTRPYLLSVGPLTLMEYSSSRRGEPTGSPSLRGGAFYCVPQGTQLSSPNSDGSNVLGPSELRASRHLAQLQSGVRRRQRTPDRRSPEPNISGLSTTDTTPENKPNEVARSLRSVDLVRRSRTVQRYCPVSVQQRSKEFFQDTLSRDTSSEIIGQRDEYSRRLGEAQALHFIEQNINREVSHDNAVHRFDVQRVRRGQCGVMKFVTMLGRGELSRKESEDYWRYHAKSSRHVVVQFLQEIMRLSTHNMTEHQRRTVAISLEYNKHLFDKSNRNDIQTTIKVLRGKYTMEAQFFFSAFSPPVVKHQIELPEQIQEFLTAMNVPMNHCSFWPRLVAFLGAFCLMSTNGQRAACFLQFIVSFEAPSKVLTGVLFPAQVRERADRRHVTFMEAQLNNSVDENMAESLLRQVDKHRETLVASICHVISSAFSSESTVEMWENSLRAKRIESLVKVCSNSGYMVKLFSNICMWVKDYVDAWMLDMTLEQYALYKISPKLPQFVISVTTLYEQDGVSRASADRTVANRVKALYAEGSRYWHYLTVAKAPAHQTIAMSKAWDLLLQMHDAARKYFVKHKYRDDPFVVYLRGAPGVGKSRLVDEIGMHLVTALLGDVEYAKYVRNPASKYWDGYEQQPVVVFDDFLQAKCPQTRSSEAMELIRAKNNQTWLLDMADLTNKGTTLFNSPFIFITSNCDIPDDLGVSSVDAVRRRRDMLIGVRVDPAFADKYGCPDLDMIRKLFGDGFYTGIYEFDLYDPRDPLKVLECNGKVMKGLNYEEMIVHLSKHARMHRGDNAPQVPLSAVFLDDDKSSSLSESVPEEILDNMFAEWCNVENFVPDDASRDLFVRTQLKTINGKPNNALWDRWMIFKQKYKQVFSAFTGIKKPNMNKYQTAMMYIAVLSGFAGLLTFAFYRRKHSQRLEEREQQNSESFVSGDAKTIYVPKNHKVRRQIISKPNQAQGSVDPRALTLVKERFCSMLCLVVLSKADGHCVSTHGLLIGGKLIAVPYHLFASTPEIHKLTIITIGGEYVYDPWEIEVREDWKAYDMSIVIMPNSFPSFPKQVQHFVNERDISTIYLSKVCMLTAQSEGEVIMPVMQFVNNAIRKGEHSYVSRGDEIHEITIISSVHYDAQTEAGDCGAPLIWFHPCVSRKIIGFHVAGGSGIGASNILTREVMQDVFNNVLDNGLKYPDTEDTRPTLRDGVANIGQMGYLGLISPSKQFRQPTKSEIIPSCVHGKFPIISAPAVLRVVDGVSPLEKGVRKAFCPVAQLPQDDLQIAIEQVINHYRSAQIPMEQRVLSMHEGLNGVGGCQWIRPLNMKTSPGYPYILIEGRKPGKLSFVHLEGGEWVPGVLLKERVEERIREAAVGNIPETIFVDVLKDERRELEKVEALKTRVFNTCPMDLSIVIRMYFGTFGAMVMHNHVTHEVAVGINYHSEEWNMLYRRLRANGSNWIAGDYSNYDKTFPRQLMLAVATIANAFYEDENSVIRETLMETLASRIHLANRVLYFSPHGNPSGNPLTSIINSIGNMLLMRLAWMKLSREHSPRHELRFGDFVSLSVYGDDNVATVPDTMRWFNMQNIAHVMAQWGVTYTPPKIGNLMLLKFFPEDKVSYLKRYFRHADGLVFAPLPEDKIRDMCNWIRECPDHREATRVNVYMAQLEMFHWGREKFAQFTNEAYKILTSVGIEPRYATYNQFYNYFVAGTLKDDPVLILLGDPLTTSPRFEEAPEGMGRGESTRSVEFSTSETIAIQNEKREFEAQAKQSKPKTPQGNATKRSGGAQASKTTVAPREHIPTQSLVNSSAPVVFQSVSAKATQLPKTSENATMKYKDTDLLLRLDGTTKIFIVRLQPGKTGIAKLDSLASSYSWYRFDANPVLKYRPLTDITSNGIWYYRVVHDTPMTKLADPLMWDINSRAFTAQKSSLPFSIVVPADAMRNKKGSPLNSNQCSFILLVHSGPVLDVGEFHLSYNITFGGVSGGIPSSTIYEVANGRFLDPLTGKPLDGVPIHGTHTAYTFHPAISAANVRALTDEMHGTPTLCVRPEDYSLVASGPDYGKVSTVAVAHSADSKPTFSHKVMEVAHNVGEAAEVVGAIARGAKQVYRYIKPLLVEAGTLMVNAKGTKTEMVVPGLDGYNGYVVVEDGHLVHLRHCNTPSLPVIVKNADDLEQNTRLGMIPFITGILGGMAVNLSLAGLQTIVSKASKQKHVVHKGMDALTAIQWWGHDEGKVDEGDDQLGPLPENPLPELPDFDEDPLAPGKEVEWSTTLRHFTGFVEDDNGKARIKWFGGTKATATTHISPPTPVYYHNVRRPWDQENKRLLGVYIELAPDLNGHYLVAQCANWGDDGCGGFLKEAKGIQYIGTVALFGGITMSRSVVKILNVDEFNSNEINFLIGQSKRSVIGRSDRSCVFNVLLGGVAEYEIASNFLLSWANHGKLLNNWWSKGNNSNATSHYEEVYFHKDFVSTSMRASLPAGLEPFGPGFDENLKAYRAAPVKARAVLPVAVEAGPLYMSINPRIDDANGWWQSSRYWMHSETNITNRWSFERRLGDSSTDADYSKCDATKCATHLTLFVKPPYANTVGTTSSPAYLCVECYGLGSDLAFAPFCGGFDKAKIFGTCFSGPLCVSRTNFTFDGTNVGKGVDLYTMFGPHKATEADESRGNDPLSPCFFTFYMMKGAAPKPKAHVFKWQYFDMCTINSSGNNVYDVTGVEAISSYYRVITTEIIPQSGYRSWQFGTNKFYATDSVSWATAPLAPGNKFFHDDGTRSIAIDPAIMHNGERVLFECDRVVEDQEEEKEIAVSSQQ